MYWQSAGKHKTRGPHLRCEFILPKQGITQLFIILRVARGRAITQEWSTRAATAPTTLMFAEPPDEGMAESEKVAGGADV